ncbi:hypothetical protein GGI20_000094 [Coemansia sp. BCRC 34301]|nr:hypothetical protein GGI20_000094 [Coemansia sp. BCRC 34301]
MIVSTYLRQAKLYSLETFQALFEIVSVVEPLSYVDMYHEYAAVLRGRNVVEVYKWREQGLAARFVVVDSRVCGIKLCANGILTVATTAWSLLVYDVKGAELLLKVDVREFIGTRFKTEAGPPQLKALSGLPGVIRIAMYSVHGFCGFTVKPEQQCSGLFDMQRYDGSESLLDAHLMFRLVAKSSPGAPAVRAMLSSTGDKSAELVVPRAFSIADGRRPPMDQEPDAVAMTDNVVALGYNNIGVSVSLMPDSTRPDCSGNGLLATRRYTGRTNTTLTTQFDMLSSKIQMLSLATQCRQYTTIRLPHSQGSLPVASLTALTLWGRTIHSLLSFTPQDRVTSMAPLLRISGAPSLRNHTTRPFALTSEGEITKLAQSPATIPQAISLYQELQSSLPPQSLTPWMLLSRCYEFKNLEELEWLGQLLCARSGHGKQSVQELLLCAYLHLRQEQKLRECVVGLCMQPVHISSATMVLVLLELQSTQPDRRLACRLWEAQLEIPAFVPSKTCVQLALKTAMHAEHTNLAVKTYQLVLTRRWTGIQLGFWADKVMIYGLAKNGLATEAIEVAMATTDHQDLDNDVVAMQTIQKYELLLKGLNRQFDANAAEAVFGYVRNELRLWPTVPMYTSLLGVLACRSDWSKIETYLTLMEEDGHVIPQVVWKRVLLGVAKQGRTDLCDKVLDIMVSRGIPHTFIVVLAAIEVFARQRDYEMVGRWYQVVYKALAAQAQKTYAEQQTVNIDGTVTHSGMSSDVQPNAVPLSVLQPEDFVEYFIQRNELVWHRSVLACLLEVVGEIGDVPLLMRIWEDIYGFHMEVRTLRMAPHMYMALARSLTRHNLLGRYESVLCEWIDNERNAFSYSQRAEAIDFVKLCLNSPRLILQQSRLRTGAHSAKEQAASSDKRPL